MKTDLTKNLPHSASRDLSGYSGRIADLEKQLGPGQSADVVREICFTFPGLLQTGDSPLYYHPTGARLVQMVVSLSAAGTSTTSIRALANGTLIGDQVNLTSGMRMGAGFFSVNTLLAKDSTSLQIRVITAGMAAQGLNAQVRFAPV